MNNNNVVYQVPFDTLQTNVTDLSIILEKGVVETIDKIINEEWKNVVPREEETWIVKKFNIPSFLIRVDCITDGILLRGICEVEEPPAAALLTSQINPQFKKLLNFFQPLWPPFRSLVADNRVTDVKQWINGFSLESDELRSYEGLLWICCRPQDDRFYNFIHRSVTPVKKEGLKTYLLKMKMGLAKLVTAGNFNAIDWNKQLIFKPIQGTRCLNTMVWWAGRPQRPKDSPNSEYIKKKISEGGEWIMQEYIVPPLVPEGIRNQLPTEYNDYAYLTRLYFAFYPHHRRYYPIGGMWNARNRRYSLIHGTPDSIFAPLFLSDTSIPKFITI